MSPLRLGMQETLVTATGSLHKNGSDLIDLKIYQADVRPGTCLSKTRRSALK
jgi:hypothetical protein